MSMRFDFTNASKAWMRASAEAVSIVEKSTYPFVFGEVGQIYTFVVLHILKSRNNKSGMSIAHLFLNAFALPYGGTKVCADGKINIEHEDKLGSSKESSNVSPCVELAVKRVNHQVNVNVGSHELRRRVKTMQ